MSFFFHQLCCVIYGLFSLSLGRYLISQGAHVGAVNSEGDTPLDIAEEEAMEELLQNEVNRQGNFEYRRVVVFMDTKCIFENLD